MEIQPLLEVESSLTILIAPPAWGKTSILLGLKGPWIFVAPLRALAEEFAKRLVQEGMKVKLLKSRNQSQWRDFAKNPSGVVVATPETLPSHLPANVIEKCIVVLDEFHLFQKWGADFRPLLREQLYAWSNLGARILGLSATIDGEQLDEIKMWSKHAFEHINIIDLGNMRFKNPPFKIFRYGNDCMAMRRRIYWESRKPETRGIIFCKTRNHVSRWLEWFAARKISCLGCVGGEVDQFRHSLLQAADKTTWIVCTSVLSHGVNLPSFSHVFLDHKPESQSMWIQMAARGGRRGEKFYLHTMDSNKLREKLEIWTFDVLVRSHLYLSA